MKVYMQSLGCSKNQVDSEMILGLCKEHNMSIVAYPNEADVIMVNTCAFIESAREEAINTILDLATYKDGSKKLVVCGCLSQRYKGQLESELPEVDRFISIDEYPMLTSIISSLYKGDFKNDIYISPLKRVYSTPEYMRYVKISDGCQNRCAFCAIPLIRGTLRSRTIEDIKEEVTNQVNEGAKEINLISQDTSKYGYDLYKRLAIVDLLKELCAIPGNFKIRMLYLYPDIVTDELIDFVKNNTKVMPYFDIPIQHSENQILKYMYRRGNKEYLLDLFSKIRREIPHAILRTTLIVGFPYETETDVDNMIEFIKEVKFDRLGAFTFSKEEDTKAMEYPDIISENEKALRFNKVMETQYYISTKLNSDKIGNTYEVMIEDYDAENFMYVGRSYAFAPDDIDGCIYVAAMEELKAGDIVNVKIVDADAYTLTGEQVK